MRAPKRPHHGDDRAVDTVSLRDYFAAAALPVAMGQIGVHPISEPWTGPDDAPAIAAVCYRLADALLAARDDAE